MSSDSDGVDLLGISPATWRSSVLHGGDRIWPETNCYVDLWIELLPALGHPAEAALSFTVLQDFEGDHFTFFKFPLEDLQRLFGLSVQELPIFDSVEAQSMAQLRRGRPVLVEVDAFWLPDAGDAYRKAHVKTSIAVIALDPRDRRLGYFHGTGYYELAGADYDGLFHEPVVLFPYAEFVKRDGEALSGPALLEASVALLRGHLEHRPRRHPIREWRLALPAHLEGLARRGHGPFPSPCLQRAAPARRQLRDAGRPISTGWAPRASKGSTPRRRPAGISRRRPRRSSSSSRGWSIAAGSTPARWISSRWKPTTI